MTQATRHFAIVDPRTAAGDPYEVAYRAVAQLEGVAKLLEEELEPTFIMVRNAALERQLQRLGKFFLRHAEHHPALPDARSYVDVGRV